MKKQFVLSLAAAAALITSGMTIAAQDAPPPPPPPGAQQGPQEHQQGSRQHPFADMKMKNMLLKNLKAEDPAKYEALMKLKESNKEEFQKQSKEIAEAAREKFAEEREAMRKLIAQYKETKDAAVLEQIKAKVTAFQQKMLKLKELDLQDAEKGIAEEKKKLEAQKASIAQDVDKRVQELINREDKPKGQRPEKGERPEKGDRPDKPGKGERPEKPDAE